jgi:predicted nucleotidyltransferase
MKNIIESILSVRDDVLFAYLFGSYARNEERESSDVDVAVYLKDISLDARLEIHHALEAALKKSVDLVVLNSVKNMYLLESILNEGIVIKDADGRPLFEVEKNLDIIDFRNFKKYIDAA